MRNQGRPDAPSGDLPLCLFEALREIKVEGPTCVVDGRTESDHVGPASWVTMASPLEKALAAPVSAKRFEGAKPLVRGLGVEPPSYHSGRVGGLNDTSLDRRSTRAPGKALVAPVSAKGFEGAKPIVGGLGVKPPSYHSGRVGGLNDNDLDRQSL